MTHDPAHHDPSAQALEAYLREAEQAIRDFDLTEGLNVTAQLRSDPPALSLLGRSEHGALEYLASGEDLKDEGSSWFLRRALRSLNDRYNAGHLPERTDSTDEPESEYLRPPDRYELSGNELG